MQRAARAAPQRLLLQRHRQQQQQLLLQHIPQQQQLLQHIPQQQQLLLQHIPQQQQQMYCLQERLGFSSSYDIFKKLKDPPGADDSKDLARKPSDKVLRLVDEVLSLSLIEAADLCDLCQEALAKRGGGPAFNAAVAAGRAPFPHPSSLFAGALMQHGAFGFAAPAVPPAGQPAAAAAAAAEASPAAGEAAAGGAAVARPLISVVAAGAEQKTAFSIRLLGFDAAKKVAVVKEVRAITASGLKESKDLVEQAPKLLRKAVPAEEAQALKAKLEAAGAQVALE
ncbi:hypothetical protein Esti_000467 [Eimeria stiedai]